MPSGLADSSHSLETRAVHERCGYRVSVDGIRSRAEYKIQCKHFEFERLTSQSVGKPGYGLVD